MSLSISLPSWEIATALDKSFNLPSDMRSTTARDQLRQLRFDQAPVMRDGRLLGWVRTSRLAGRGLVEDRTTLLDQCTVLSRDTAVGDAMRLVTREHLVFLAGAGGISEFVVVSDLDRHAVRCYLFVLLSELEMQLADLVDQSLAEDEVMRHIRGGDRRRYNEAAERDLETRAVEYLVFSAYKELTPLVPDLVSCFPQSSAGLDATFDSFTRLRNCVAHPSKSLTAEFDPDQLSSLVDLIERFVLNLRTKPTDR